MSLVSLPRFAAAFVFLAFAPGLANAADRWAAINPNSEVSTGVVWGATEEDARREAASRCLRISKTCASRGAVTKDMEAVFVTVCCVNPRLGCQTTSNRNIRNAQDASMKTLRNAGFSNCALRQAVSASTGRSVGR